MSRVKICGVTRVQDAIDAVEAGADAIGLNFWPGTPRCVDVETARGIVEAIERVAAKATRSVVTVGVFVNASYEAIADVKARTGIRCVQLHGDEPIELLERFLPHAYKALRVRGPETMEEARRLPGEHVLLDAYVKDQPGGTGQAFNWALARELAREKHVTLAGGLHPGNVAEAVEAVQPFCVDVASGVESAPGIKDRAAVVAFIRAAKALQS